MIKSLLDQKGMEVLFTGGGGLSSYAEICAFVMVNLLLSPQKIAPPQKKNLTQDMYSKYARQTQKPQNVELAVGKI